MCSLRVQHCSVHFSLFPVDITPWISLREHNVTINYAGIKSPSFNFRSILFFINIQTTLASLVLALYFHSPSNHISQVFLGNHAFDTN